MALVAKIILWILASPILLTVAFIIWPSALFIALGFWLGGFYEVLGIIAGISLNAVWGMFVTDNLS